MASSGSRRRSAVAALMFAVLFLVGCADAGSVEADDSAGVAEAKAPAATAEQEPTRTSAADEGDSDEESARDRDPAGAVTGSALQMLYELEVKGRAPKTGYDRELFGWRDDVDHNGCDTRNDVLRRDLEDITLKSGGCVVLGGSLTSDYTGDTFDFIRGDGNNIDIDHVVALSNAWQTGAQQLSEDELLEFGNEPVNLLAVESSVNRSKGDGDAATWLPPRKGYRCEYVARQIQVKHDYDLWVTPPEFDAMEGLLLDCDEDEFGDDEWPDRHDGDVKPEPAPEYEPEPQYEPKPDPKPESKTSGGGSSGSSSESSSSGSSGGSASSGSGTSGGGGVYFKNCDAARDAGAAPVHAGDPGYAGHLDRDGDGIGCEWS
ncbi:MAG: GmrSD restriction endonuclease domain-containing protein [Brevibacterium yomogidense]